MFDLARFGHTEELVSYIDRRAPVNLTNEKGDTLLLFAACHGHPGVGGRRPETQDSPPSRPLRRRCLLGCPP